MPPKAGELEKKIPKYGPGDTVNIEIDIVDSRTEKDLKTGKLFSSYKVKPANEDTSFNNMVIREEIIQD